MAPLLNNILRIKYSTSVSLVFFLFFALSAKGNYLENYIAKSTALSDEAFLENISYEEILKKSQGVPYYTSLKQQLDDNNRVAGVFFLILCEKKLDINPLNINDISSLNEYLVLGEFLVKQETREFDIASDLIFQTLADSLNLGFKTEKLSKSDENLMAIVEKLKTYQYHVSIPTSNQEKLVHHVKNGNFSYVLGRAWLDYPIVCILAIITFVITIFLVYKKIKKK